MYHAGVVVMELLPPTTVPARGAARFRPWLEVSALVTVAVPAWRVREDGWLHGAAPLTGQGLALDQAVPFSPGRRAGALGEPQPEQRDGEGNVTAGEVETAARAIVAALRPTLFRQADLGVVSHVNESAAAFRRRVLAAATPFVRQRGRDEALAASLAQLAGAIDTRQLQADELVVKRLRVGVVWYPAGEAPACASDDLMLAGGPLSWR